MKTVGRNSHQRSALSLVFSQAVSSPSSLSALTTLGLPPPSPLTQEHPGIQHVLLCDTGWGLSDSDGWLVLPDMLKPLLHDQAISLPLPQHEQVQASSTYPSCLLANGHVSAGTDPQQQAKPVRGEIDFLKCLEIPNLDLDQSSPSFVS